MYPLPVLSTVVALAAAVGGAFWWPLRPVLMAAGAAAAAVVSLVTTVLHPGPGNDTVANWLLVETAAGLWVVAQAVRRLPARTSALVGPLVVVAIGVSPLRIGRWLTPPAPAWELVVVCACLTLLAVIATGTGLYLRWLDQERARSVAEARRAQRVQLARDLHDWLAHEMTGIVLAAQAGQLDAADPQASARMFGEIEAAGTRGLDAMDRALRLLRDAAGHTNSAAERPPTHADVAEVVHRFAASSPSGVDAEIATDLDELRPEVVATVHRVVVESLTNVRRHAPAATHVGVTVTRHSAAVTVTVTNNGGRPPRRGLRAGRGGGTGLTSLTESVEALGGTLRAGADVPAGWTVRAEVPG